MLCLFQGRLNNNISSENIKNPNIRSIVETLAKILVPDSTTYDKDDPIKSTWGKIKHLGKEYKKTPNEPICYLLSYVFSLNSKDYHKELFDPSLKTGVYATIEVLEWYSKHSNK